MEQCIAAGQFAADEVIAVIGKTEGNGGVNDFTRILADQAFRRVLLKNGTRSEVEVATVPMVWSGGCDGVIAKRTDLPYQSGNRDGMQKIKNFRSADCVIGGFRYATNKQGGRKVVGSLLLGLYDDEGLLHHVGFTSAIRRQDKPALTAKLAALMPPHVESPEAAAMSLIAEMAGAVALSRSISDIALSDALLDASRAALKQRFSFSPGPTSP